MRYININNGAVIDSPSKITGNAWKPYEGIKQTKQVTDNDQQYIEEEVNLDEMTNAQLVEFAKNHEVKVNAKDTKQALIEKIVKAFE